MKTKSIYLPIIALVFLCLPFVSMAQGNADALKKTKKTTVSLLSSTLTGIKSVSGKSIWSTASE
jgi:O-antigen/teichoic acid export membrane protein